MVYSTCTFAPEEDEGSINVHRHTDFHILKVEPYQGMSKGHPEWISDPAAGIEDTLRLWPHLLKCEGHFLAVLERDGELRQRGSCSYCPNGLQKGIREKDCKPWITFRNAFLQNFPEGTLFLYGEQLYLAPEGMPSTDHLKVLRPGLHPGNAQKDRFEPSCTCADIKTRRCQIQYESCFRRL